MQFEDAIQNTMNDRIVVQEITDCIFEIMFDENVLLITYNSELYSQLDFVPRIEEIVNKNFEVQ